VEQVLRDARVLTIFEGTTGMQAIDLLHRRLWKDEGRGLQAFLRAARAAEAELAKVGDQTSADAAHEVFDSLEQAAGALDAMKGDPRGAEAGACSFLALAGHAGLTWIAVRLAKLEASATADRLRALSRYHLAKAGATAVGLSRQIHEAGAAQALAKSVLQ